VKCKSSKSYFQSNLPEKFRHIRSPDRVPVRVVEHVWASLFLPVNQTYSTPAPGSSKDCQTCSAPRPDMSGQLFPSVAKSFCQTYPAGSSSSCYDLWIYLVPGQDISGLSVLTRVKSQHRTCSMPKLGSITFSGHIRSPSQTCLNL
jgi:hypothetical protein